jgi:phage terminase large subunit-like protein
VNATSANDDPVTAYAKQAADSREDCVLVRAAAARHLDNLKNQGKSWFPYRFDAEEAANRIAFFRLARHIKGEWAGRPIEPAPWQTFKTGSLFGWKRLEDGLRRFRVAYIEVPRGQGKSTDAAVMAINLAFFDGEPGADVFVAATKRDQARITFESARQMVLRSPKLKQRIQVLVNNLHNPRTASKLEPLGADADSMDGLRVHGAIVDEPHAHRTRAVVDVLDSATGTRRQPLIYYITTAGSDRLSVCWQHHEYSRQVLERVFDDPTWFAFIACADEGDDPFDERTWRKANLNLGVSVKLDDLRRKADVAKRQPPALNEFLRKHLNVWTTVTERFFDLNRWAECRTVVPDAELIGVPCFGGLDLGLSDDFSAFALVWVLADGRVAVRMRFWIPQGALERFPNRPYAAWSRTGALTVTEGDTADLDQIEDDVRDLCVEHGVREVAFDKRFASQLALHLQGAGITMVDTPQGFQLNEALRKLSATVADRVLCHGNDAVLTWMAGNAQVRTGRNGELRLDKERSADKVDGIAALAMALSRVLAQPVPARSIFDAENFDPASVWL